MANQRGRAWDTTACEPARPTRDGHLFRDGDKRSRLRVTRECPGHGISVGRGEDKWPNGAGVQKIHRFFNGQRIVAQVRRVYLTCDRLMKDGEHTRSLAVR